MATRRDVWIIEERKPSCNNWSPTFCAYLREDKLAAMRLAKMRRDNGEHARVTQYIAKDEPRWRGTLRLQRRLTAMTEAKNKALAALKNANDPMASSHEWKHWLRALPALIAELEDVT